MSRSGEKFVIVKATLVERRELSVRLDRADLTAPVWLPRAWVDTADNVQLGRSEIGAEVEIRVLGDRAEEKGLLPK